MLTISSTSLLFLYRVRAVFSNSEVVRTFFSFIWIVQLGISVLIPLSLDGAVSLFGLRMKMHTQNIMYISLVALI